jgi:4-aminobutyrate aminotransferase-like enzyme
LNKLRGLKDRHPPIGDVRGIDLMIGVEIVRDRDTHAPAGVERERIVRGAFEKGLSRDESGVREMERNGELERSMSFSTAEN